MKQKCLIFSSFAKNGHFWGIILGFTLILSTKWSARGCWASTLARPTFVFCFIIKKIRGCWQGEKRLTEKGANFSEKRLDFFLTKNSPYLAVPIQLLDVCFKAVQHQSKEWLVKGWELLSKKKPCPARLPQNLFHSCSCALLFHNQNVEVHSNNAYQDVLLVFFSQTHWIEASLHSKQVLSPSISSHTFSKFLKFCQEFNVHSFLVKYKLLLLPDQKDVKKISKYRSTDS